MVPQGDGDHYSLFRDFITLAQDFCVHGIKLIPWFMADVITVMAYEAAQLAALATKTKQSKTSKQTNKKPKTKKLTGSPTAFVLIAADLVIIVTSYEDHGVSNHRWLNYLFNWLFELTAKITAKSHIANPLCAVTGGFSPQRASNGDRVSMSWRHHVRGIWLINEHMHKQQGLILLTQINVFTAWINNHMPSEVWDEIAYPFLNFDVCNVEV